MANKVYYLDRDGATPQVVPANTDEKLKVYDSYDDVDTTELVDGEIVSTKEGAGNGSNVYDYINRLGIPVGAIMAFYGPVLNNNWLECDGRDTTGTAEELQTHYPALYTYLGNSNVLPDLRDRALFGIGGDLINVGDTTNGAIPNIKGNIRGVASSTNNDGFSDGVLFSGPSDPWYTRGSGSANTGATSKFNANNYNNIYKDNHSYVTPKSVGVRWCIKATD